MQHEFEMSMVGELNMFLGLEIKQLEHGIFISQSKYAWMMIKKFGLENLLKCKYAQSKYACMQNILPFP